VLIGLLFVALSINREATAAKPHLAGQALQVLFALGSVFVLSLVVLIPDQSSSANDAMSRKSSAEEGNPGDSRTSC
jgi:hypothetical protein